MAVSSAFLVAMVGISGSISGTARQVVDSVAGNAVIEVSGITDSGFDQGIQHSVAAVPGVDAAVPLIRMQVATDAGTALLIGANASGIKLTTALSDIIEHQLPALVTAPGSVLVGPALARPPGSILHVGDRQVTAVAVVTGPAATRINQGYFILAPLGVAQRLTGRPGRLDSVLVTLKPENDVASVRADITGAVNGRAVVSDPLQRAARTGNGVRIVEYLTLMSAAVGFVVAAFLIYTVMAMAISQRRRTLSMLRAAGGGRLMLITNLLAESAVLGVLGGVIGAAVGVAIGRVAVAALPTVLMQAAQIRLEYMPPWYAVPLAVLMSMATTVAAAAVAAYQIYRVTPVEALVPVEVAAGTAPPGWLRLLGLAAAAVLITAAIAIQRIAPNELLSAFAIALFFGSGIALCLAAASWIVATTSAAARVWGAPGQLAAANIVQSPLRVWSTLMTVFVAVAMTVTITGANRDMIAAAERSVASLGQTPIFVSSNPPDELPAGPQLPDRLGRQVARLPGVTHVVEGLVAFASVNGVRVMLSGFASGTSNPIYQAVNDNVRGDLLAGRGVVLSRDLGKALRVSAGDVLRLPTPTGVRPIRVLQLVPYLSVLTGVIGMDFAQLRAWFDLHGPTTIEVYTAPGASPKALSGAVREMTPIGAYVYSGQEALIGVQGAVRQAAGIADGLWVIVVLIAAIALLNTLTLSVLERRREVGVLRAIGTSRRFALQMIIAEAAGIGLVGGLIGLGFGCATEFFYDSVTPGILNFDVPYEPSVSAAGFALLAFVLSMLGSIPPSLRAARLNIIDAIGVN